MTISELAQQITDTEGQQPAPSVLPAPFAKEDDMAKVGPKEAALREAREDDLSIPAALDRTKGMSKEDFAGLHEKLGKPAPKGKGRTKLTVVPAARPANLTEADKKAIAEIKKEEETVKAKKKAESLAKLKAVAAGKKAIKDAAKATKAANAPEKPTGKPKTSSPPIGLASRAKPASEPRKGSKTELIGELLRRKKGCTTADVLKATGWPAVSMPQQAKAVGVGLRKEKNGKVTRYWAV
jgi:hypothetical protein